MNYRNDRNGSIHENCVEMEKEYILAKANDLVAEMTRFNVQAKDLQGADAIVEEYIDNNNAVCQMLVQCGIVFDK